jgi:hypothetical protein
VAITGWDWVHLLAIPVEGLVVEPALVDTAIVPVDGGRAAMVVPMVVTVVAAWRSARTVAAPRICAGSSKANAEQSGDSDSGCQSCCR